MPSRSEQEARLRSALSARPSVELPRRWAVVGAALLVLAVAAFVVLFVLAARAYPGGTWFDPSATGHDVLRNTMCDVARATAINGAPNPIGAPLARAAMMLLAFGLGVHLLVLPWLFPTRSRLGRAVRVLGALTVPCGIAVVLLPTDLYGRLHGFAIVATGLFGFAATSLALHGLKSEPHAPRVLVGVGAAAIVIAAGAFVYYVQEFVRGSPAQVEVPIFERIATVLLLGWMLLVARALLRREGVQRDARSHSILS